MRTVLLMLAVTLLAGCLSAARTREAHCLGLLMNDAWQVEEDMRAAEQAWRAAQQARFERSAARRDSSLLSHLIANGYALSETDVTASSSGRNPDVRPQDDDGERALYRQVTAATEV